MHGAGHGSAAAYAPPEHRRCRLLRDTCLACWAAQETAAVGRGRLCGKKILLVKPMT